MSSNKPLTLEEKLEHLVTEIMKIHPHLKLDDDKKQEFVTRIAKVLDDQGVDTRELDEKEFLMKLIPDIKKALVQTKLTAVLDGQFNPKFEPALTLLNSKFNDEELLKLLLSPDLKKSLQESNRLSPQEFKDLESTLADCKKDFDEQLAIAPKPESKPEEKENDIFACCQLMLASSVNGGAVVLDNFLGNFIGFTDFSPLQGSSPLDQQNSLNFQQGDPLGLKNEIETNLLAEDSPIAEIADNTTNAYRHHHDLKP